MQARPSEWLFFRLVLTTKEQRINVLVSHDRMSACTAACSECSDLALYVSAKGVTFDDSFSQRSRCASKFRLVAGFSVEYFKPPTSS